MDLLNKYFELQKEIYDYFDYVEDWVTIPLDDQTHVYWNLDGSDTSANEVRFCLDKTNLENWIKAGDWDVPGVNGDDCYSNEIYTQRFLPKWVYRGKEFTMIVVDTHTDGNKYFTGIRQQQRGDECDRLNLTVKNMSCRKDRSVKFWSRVRT